MPDSIKEEIFNSLLDAGASAVGFAKAGKISSEVETQYKNWIGEEFHGEMGFLERHIPLRQHTDNVLQGAKTIISLAFSYVPAEWKTLSIAAYAYGEDYHNVLRKILRPIIKDFQDKYGGKWRVCIDSAPVAERYWAVKSGIGKRGVNGSIIVEDCGSLGFLVEILTTIEIEPDKPSIEKCDSCGACIKICPGKAIKGDGTIDARKCINYLTIEKKGDFTEKEKMTVSSNEGHLFGCDLCLRVCPHNIGLAPSGINEFNYSEEIRKLTPLDIINMGKDEFKDLFSKSPLLYAGYEKLVRNAQTLKK